MVNLYVLHFYLVLTDCADRFMTTAKTETCSWSLIKTYSYVRRTIGVLLLLLVLHS
jgi:hypothetical protein